MTTQKKKPLSAKPVQRWRMGNLSREALGFIDEDEERAIVALVAKHGAAPDPCGNNE